MDDPTKSPFEVPQLATGGSYLRMPDQSLLKIEGHDVTEKEQAERVKVRDAALADAQAKHDAEAAKAAKGGGEGGNAEVPQAAPVQGASPAPASSELPETTVTVIDPSSKLPPRRVEGRAGKTTEE